jgi:hypothetical protein
VRDGCRARESTDFGYACWGLGAGRHRRAVFFGSIDAVAANGVRWAACSTLVAAVSHFSVLDTELEVPGSERSVGLAEDEVDALWTRVHAASNSLALNVPPSIAHNPPDGTGE